MDVDLAYCNNIQELKQELSFCSLDRAFFNYEENNQQNALIVSLIGY
jgi:hypothetical protein